MWDTSGVGGIGSMSQSLWRRKRSGKREGVTPVSEDGELRTSKPTEGDDGYRVG